MSIQTAKKITDKEIFMSMPLNMFSQDVIEAFMDEQDFNQAIEFWFVSNWLCDHLKTQGETVCEYGFHNIWFRQCSGQAIYMDSCIQKIAKYIDDL